MSSEGDLFNKKACFLAEMNGRSPMRQQENCSGEKILALSIILRSKPPSCLGVGYTDHTYIKERLHLKLKLKERTDAHG